MRMEFSHRTLHGAARARQRLFFATILVLFIFLLDVMSGGKVRGEVRSVAAYMWNGSSRLRESVADSGYFSSHRALAEDNATLREQVAAYQEDAAAYQVAAQENDQLRAMLHLAQTSQGITAPVVSSFRTSPYGTFLIGAGQADDVVSGSLVLSDTGFVIGRVSDVSAHTALVTGIFTAGTSIDALIRSAAVSVSGQGGGNARALVPLGVTIVAGDPVVAPSLRGRAIGIVGRVESTPTSPDQTVYISFPINLSELRFVYVVPANE